MNNRTMEKMQSICVWLDFVIQKSDLTLGSPNAALLLDGANVFSVVFDVQLQF